MQKSIKIFDAIEFAEEAHRGQTRKSNGKTMTIHLYGVALLLSKYGYSEDVVIAGILHDVIEDCPEYSIKDIEMRFGSVVAMYVLDVTEKDKTLEWKVRKLHHIEHMKTAVYESKVLCAADKINNLYTLKKDLQIQGEEIWDKFNASKTETLWYYSTICDSILSGYEDAEIPIFKQLKGLVNEIILGGN